MPYTKCMNSCNFSHGRLTMRLSRDNKPQRYKAVKMSSRARKRSIEWVSYYIGSPVYKLSPNTVARRSRRLRYRFEIVLFGIKGRAGVTTRDGGKSRRYKGIIKERARREGLEKSDILGEMRTSGRYRCISYTPSFSSLVFYVAFLFSALL